MYNLGPTSRLKGFHKSHNIKSYCKPSKEILVAKCSNSYNSNLLESSSEENSQQEEQLAPLHSFGTSFLLSNDYLNGMDGSIIGISIYQQQLQLSMVPPNNNSILHQQEEREKYNYTHLEMDGQVSLFHIACTSDASLTKVIRMLDMNRELLNSCRDHVSPLYVSIQANCYAIFCELMKRNADIKKGFYKNQDQDYSAISCLYMAIHVGNYRMVEDLLGKIPNEDINQGKHFKKGHQSEYTETPLFLAVRMGDVKMIQILLNPKRFWSQINILNCMISEYGNTSIVNTVFQALFSIEGKTFLERERKSKACFLEIMKMYNVVKERLSGAIEEIASSQLISPLSALHFSRCCYHQQNVLSTIHSPLYLAIMNENDYLTRELVHCVPNKCFGELVVSQSKGNEFESCLYLAIYKRSIHVIIYLLRVYADEMEDVSKLKEFAMAENIDLDHYIKVARHFTNQMYKLLASKGIDESATNSPPPYSDMEIITSDCYYLLN